MDLDELRGFVAVVETGSFLGAATKLAIPRATLRRRVDALEARAGVALLDRSTRGVTVTKAGALVAERGRRLVVEGAALLTAAREAGRAPSQPLRIHLPVGLPPSLFVSVGELCRLFVPDLRLTLITREQPLDGLHADVDLAVHFGDEQPTGAWSVRELMRVPIRLLASPAYFARHGQPQTPDELQAHALASWVGPGQAQASWPLRDGGHLDVSPVFISNDAHALRQLARAGTVLVRVPDANLDLLGLETDELVPVLDGWIAGELPLNLTVADTLAAGPALARVVEMLANFARPSI